jgi:hypothetical protein
VQKAGLEDKAVLYSPGALYTIHKRPDSHGYCRKMSRLQQIAPSTIRAADPASPGPPPGSFDGLATARADEFSTFSARS